MTRILIADDQALVRDGFRAILEGQPDCEVVGLAEDGVVAVELARRLRPDIVLMDIRMPRLDGVEATRRICADPQWPGRVIVLTTYDADENVWDAFHAGASGFLLKTTTSPRPRSSPTSTGCSPSSASVIGSRRSSTPTSPVS